MINKKKILINFRETRFYLISNFSLAKRSSKNSKENFNNKNNTKKVNNIIFDAQNRNYMIAPTKLRAPENWQDFEKLCKKLWGEIWECPDTIKRNGRNGQKQNGIDVYGQPKGEMDYYGIQCKVKDEYTNSQLTNKEIDEEILKALNFKPQIKRFIFATTANRNVVTEEYIREKNIESLRNGLFGITISFWEDIVDLLEERRNTYQWYVNNCQYTDSSDVEVLISAGNIIRPTYNKITKKYKLHQPIQSNSFLDISTIGQQLSIDLVKPSIFNNYSMLNSLRKIDYRWCDFTIKIINIGSTTIEDYNLELTFDGNSIEKISDNHSYINATLISSLERLQINRQRDDEREVYKSNEYNNVINYYPKKKILVQEDSCSFSVGVIPKSHETKEIKLYWKLKARDYNKNGELKLMVVPSFENEEKVIKVHSENDIKPDEIIIQPKIKME